MLVRWAEKSRVFVDPSIGKNPRPKLFHFIKKELETKVVRDYRFEEAPIEYNTWLVFRRIVDLILMCDFVSYCLFAFACASQPEGETVFGMTARWIGAWALIAFNLWVKLDAHRVVKDFAWYWGDFFYLIDQDLTFDGVFEMAPHPMYSVGYIGYYGISLLAASYKVLFISIAAHAAQFIFLVWVENPHIEKTYNPPPPRQRIVESQIAAGSQQSVRADHKPSVVHSLVGPRNIDLYRITDSSVLVCHFMLVALTALTPSTTLTQNFFLVNAAIWRLWYSVGMGFLLNRQSQKKQWTRHFLKYGDTTEEAWRQWKGLYHLSMTMCYSSFVAAAWKVYQIPIDWDSGLVLLKHVIGLLLVALQMWVSVSIYESLGEFGWFYGDFFFDQSPKLTYSGIYRFLNNPERILGHAGVWGIALMTDSRAIFALALGTHAAGLGFSHFVETPHMRKLYGRQLRQDAGLVRTLKKSLPPPLRQLQNDMDKVLGGTFDVVDDFLESARPKFAAGVKHFVNDTRNLLNTYPARISVTMVEPDMVGFDPQEYAIEIEAAALELSKAEISGSSSIRCQARRSAAERGEVGPQTLSFEYGTPIRVSWAAPPSHSKKDWVGLYRVTDSTSREVTRVSSRGRWTATNSGEYGFRTAEQGLLSSDVPKTLEADESVVDEGRQRLTGDMIFSGDKLWWTQGTFEFRYHHGGKHNVMAISRPFEIRITRFDESDVIPECLNAQHNTILQSAVEESLLPVVRNCFDRDLEIAPDNVDDRYGALVERDGKFARRVVFVVREMFGIEFAPQVVRADGNIKNLAWRICNAKKVLVSLDLIC